MPSEPVKTRRALLDIIDNISLAEAFAAGLSPAQLEADTMRFYAVVRCLEIISEASRRLPQALKARWPQIPWQQVAGAGNVYRHDYDNVTASAILQTVMHSLPDLRVAAEAELPSLRE